MSMEPVQSSRESFHRIREAVSKVNSSKAEQIFKGVEFDQLDQISLAKARKLLKRSAKVLGVKTHEGLLSRISAIFSKSSLGEVWEKQGPSMSRAERFVTESMERVAAQDDLWLPLIEQAKKMGYEPPDKESMERVAAQDDLWLPLIEQAKKMGYEPPDKEGLEQLKDIAKTFELGKSDDLEELYQTSPEDAFFFLTRKLEAVEIQGKYFQKIFEKEGKGISPEVAIELVKNLEGIRQEIYAKGGGSQSVGDRVVRLSPRIFHLVPHGGDPPSVLLYEEKANPVRGSYKLFRLGHGVNAPEDKMAYLELLKVAPSTQNEVDIQKELIQLGVRNIPKIFDFQPGKYLLVEIMDSDALEAYSGHGIEENALYSLAIQVGEALADMHEFRYIHRDLKPDNILIGKDRVLLTDFGFTEKIPDDKEGVSSSKGTAGYLPPEFFRQGELLTPKADVYSYGVTLFALRYQREWQNILDERSGWDRALGSNYTKDQLKSRYKTLTNGSNDPLDEIIMRCLDSDPNERPTMEKVVETLKRLQAS